MEDTAIQILQNMNGAEFVIVFAILILAVVYLVPKIKYVHELLTSWYEKKKRQDEVFETILQNKKDIEELQKNDVKYYDALKTLERSLSASISDLKHLLKEYNNTSEERYVQQVRSEILDFCNACTVRKYKQDAFMHIIDLHNEYENILKRRGDSNGQVSESYNIMMEIYREKIRNGEFAEH